MLEPRGALRTGYTLCCVSWLLTGSFAFGQILNEDFDGVAGTGGGIFFSGAGEVVIESWDPNLIGENAFAGADGNADVGFAAAAGDSAAGVDGSGAGVIEVGDVLYDLIWQPFTSVTGTGGGEFLAGGAGPDTANFVENWDDGIDNDIAFGGTFDGAVLDGSMSAGGLPTGGVDGAGGAFVDVDAVTLNGGGWFAGLQFDIGSFPGSVVLENPGFEGVEAWTAFSNAFESPDPVEVAPRTGDGAAKTFGAFSGASGLYQDLPAEPGQTVMFSAFALTPAFDSIGATANAGQLRIEWRDAANTTVLLVDQVTILDPADPDFAEDTWFGGTLSAIAPAEAAFARVILWFEQPASEGGAVWWDDASVQLSGAGAADLSQFDLTVAARGVVDAPGEVLGGIQLRIEDPDGNRLFTDVPATSGFQTIGGPLDTFTEADATGTPAGGVFNRNASSYRVVVAFSDTDLWGTGGTIEIDDLLLANDNPAGSAWYAGIFFDGLQIPIVDATATQILDPSMLMLIADVAGDQAAPYALRLEGIDAREAGLDEDYGSVLGDCGSGDPADCLIYDPDTGGPGFTLDFDSGITGETAFAGVAAPIFPFLDAGITVAGDPAGGIDGAGGLTLDVRGLTPGTGGTWFAGIDYPEQLLAASDLSQVELRADIRGRTSAFGGLGFYELRIEDAEGDRLAFQMLATGSWQQVGGTLDTAVELPPADGSAGNGFDTDSSSYNVVIAFVDEPPTMPLVTTWSSGGILDVDNLFLTPASANVELGRFAFLEAGNTAFKQVGGLLSQADVQTLDVTGVVPGPEVIDIEDGTAGASGPMAGDVGWDPTLTNEVSFAGGDLIDATIETCADCGVNGSQAIRAVVDQASNGWWAGIYFEDVAMDLSAGAGDNLAALVDQELSAIINAAGSTLPYGIVELRIEDAQTDSLFFHLEADGTEQFIGGTLDGTTRGFADPGLQNGVFNYLQPTYNITVAFTNFTTPKWGGTIDLKIDNITYTSSGTEVDVPDSYTVTATFDQEAEQWGSAGQLTVDNLVFAIVPNTDGNGSLDLRDVAQLQQCGSSAGAPVTDACKRSDLNGDGVFDANDDVLGAIGLVPPLLVLPD